MAGFGTLAFMPSGSIDLTLRGRDAYTVGPQGQLIPRQPEAGVRRITPASGVTASTAPTPGFGDVIARDAARRLQFANRYRAQQMARQQQPAAPAPAAPAAPTFGQRVGTAFRQPLTSPTGMGIMSAALTGLEQAGPQPVPTSTGQILARMGAAGLQAYGSAQEAEAAQAAAARKEAREIAALDKPKFQVVGDRLFKIMPDGRYEDITGDMPAKPAKIAGEGPRVRQRETGREVETVYDAQNNLYPAGAQMTPENRLDPEGFDVVSVYSEMTVKDRSTARQTIKEEERPIKMIDKLASEIIKLEPGAAARIRRDIITSLKTKAPDEFGELTDEEIAARVADGALTALVGASRLSLFGPGVLTASEAELARQVFVGPGGQINDPTLALNLLYSIRNDFMEGYSDSVDYFNSHRGNRYKKYTGEDVLDWNSMVDEQGRIRIGGSDGTSAATANTTPGGNTWSRVN